MKPLLIPVAVAGFFATAIFSQSGSQRHHIVQGSASTNLPPGIYQATPYSSIVVIPEPIDRGSVHMLGSTNDFAIFSLHPLVHLEPKK